MLTWAVCWMAVNTGECISDFIIMMSTLTDTCIFYFVFRCFWKD